MYNAPVLPCSPHLFFEGLVIKPPRKLLLMAKIISPNVILRACVYLTTDLLSKREGLGSSYKTFLIVFFPLFVFKGNTSGYAGSDSPEFDDPRRVPEAFVLSTSLFSLKMTKPRGRDHLIL